MKTELLEGMAARLAYVSRVSFRSAAPSPRRSGQCCVVATSSTAGLQDAFAAAKQLLDRRSPVAEQETLALPIESGERRVHRVPPAGWRAPSDSAENVLQHALAIRIVIEGADAGLHVVVWSKDLCRSLEDVLVEDARRSGVGIHFISPLYGREKDEGCAPDRERCRP